jgi:hypothetical protein
MVETNPIPRKTNLFVQVSVAVVSGVAATVFIQNFIAAPRLPAPAPVKTEAPSEAKPEPAPEPAAPPADNEVDKAIPHPPVADAMMVVPETGGAAPGIVSLYGEEPASPREAAAPPAAVKPAPRTAPAKKAIPAIHLEHSGTRSVYSGPAVGHAFSSDLKPLTFAKIAAPAPKAPAPEAAKAPPPAPPLKFYPILLDKKAIPRKDLFVPSLLHPEIVPEVPFWTDERKRKAVISGLITVAGILYLMLGAGIIRVDKPKYEAEDRL